MTVSQMSVPPSTIAQKYTRVAIWLHWIIAVLILGNIVGGLTADLWPGSMIRTVVDTHKSVGMTVLGLVILRVLWRATHRPPPMSATYKPWECILAHTVHYGFYVLILALPLTGYLHDSAWKDAPKHPTSYFGLFSWPRAPFLENLDPASKDYWHGVLFTVHEWSAYALLALLVLHVAGALKHQYVDRHPELQRMTP